MDCIFDHCIHCTKDITPGSPLTYIYYVYAGYQAVDAFCPNCGKIMPGNGIQEYTAPKRKPSHI